MNSPNIIGQVEDGQEENGKDWSKEETSKNSKSSPQAQVPQQMVMKPENYNQYVVGYSSTYKDPMRPDTVVNSRPDDGPRFDQSVRVDQIPRVESVPRYEPNHRLDAMPRYPATYQRFAAPTSDCFQPKKKPRTEEDDAEPHESAVPNEITDDNEAFGKVVAAQLRSMNKVQKIIAQRLISEICFRGQLQYLQPTSSLSQQTLVQSQAQQQAVYAARPQRYVRAGQEITYLHPQALRQVIQPGVSNDFHNVQQAHPDQPAANMNPMESYNL